MDSKGEKAMRKAIREYMLLYLAIGTVVGVSLVGMGCSSTPMRPAELDQARMAYAQAQDNPQVSTHAPVALHEAEEAVRRAELTWDKEKDVREVQNLSAVAMRRVEVARAAAEKKQAEVDAEELRAARERVLLDARTREAQLAQEQAQRAQEQTQRAQEIAERAQREADQAYQQVRAITTQTTQTTQVEQASPPPKEKASPGRCKRGAPCPSRKKVSGY